MKSEFLYTLNRCIAKLPFVNEEKWMINFIRRSGVEVGTDCHIYSNIISAEPFLIHIANNVTISTDVQFVTHDNSIIKCDNTKPNLFGHIYIGNNCFIGQRSLIMYGVTIADNTIIAAGSVVTSSFDEKGIIIGGNPAKKIGTIEQFLKSKGKYAMSKGEVKKNLNNPELFVKKRVKHE